LLRVIKGQGARSAFRGTFCF